MPAKPTYTDVILPLPLPGLYTYHIPEELSGSVAPGKRVVVQFGKKKNYTAIVHTIHKNKPAEYETKAILSVLDDIPVINPLQVRFWEWIAGYYLCTLGEVYKAALPSGLKLESETKVIFNPGFRLHETLDGKEELLHRVLESRNVMTIRELNSLPGIKNCLPVIKSLHDKKAVFIEEQMIEKYKPVYITYVGLPENLGKEENLRPVFDELARAPKQLEILMTYINLSRFFSAGRRQRVTKKQLMDNCSAGHQAFTSLITKGILLTRDEQTGRLPDSEDTKGSRKNLNDFQEKALEDIRTSFTKKDVVLLHGVTSSGKTEIYIHLIQEYLDAGKQVLYLLPEIALTAQIINRLKHVFGKQAGVYHSKFSDSERVEIWNSVLNSAQGNGYNLILGVRSSVFLPFSNLGLVIVDEEHENTYKQYDPAPRYNARDAAIVLAQLHGAKTLLGSATPSIESYYNAEIQKYGFVEMNQRYLDIKMPDILIANTREAYKRKEMHSHFTPLLLEKIDNALCNKGQVILFQNRRGFAPYLECNTCGWIPQCPHCDVCLTYHKHINQLICHYCGHAVNTPVKCSACGMADLLTRGFGTEKIEDEIAVFFPKARIARMDLDTTRSKKSYERIIGDFENRSIDILVGTQMVTKGLDFDNVSVVGVLNADNMLNFPDFRAFERSFQLMAQVSGRAGRKHKQGEVIIQTTNPKHPIIKDVVNNSYRRMFNSELSERKKFRYPPFYRLVEIRLKHKKKNILNTASRQMADELKAVFGNRVLGPEYPLVNRIQNWYIKCILIKIEREKAGEKSRQLLLESIEKVRLKQEDKTLQVVVDVDPM